MKYSKGLMWLSDCRIPFEADDKFDIRRYKEYHDTFSSYENTGSADGKYEVNEPNTKGRFTPNLLVCDDMLNDGIKPNKGHRAKSKVTGYGEFGGGKSEYHGIGEYMEVDSKSRYYDLDKWFDKVIEQL
jgi:hypothetical protein